MRFGIAEMEEEQNWFANRISCKLGKGKNINFWKVKCLGFVTLNLMFPQLFHKVLQGTHKMSEMGGCVRNKLEWNLNMDMEKLADQ